MQRLWSSKSDSLHPVYVTTLLLSGVFTCMCKASFEEKQRNYIYTIRRVCPSNTTITPPFCAGHKRGERRNTSYKKILFSQPKCQQLTKLPFTCGVSFILILKVYFPTTTYSVKYVLPNEKASPVLEINVSKPVKKQSGKVMHTFLFKQTIWNRLSLHCISASYKGQIFNRGDIWKALQREAKALMSGWMKWINMIRSKRQT